MNENRHPDSTSGDPWAAPGQQAPAPDTSMRSGSEKAGPAAVGLLKSAAQGAHHTIDRIADGAEPAVRQVGDSVAAAEQTLHAKAEQLRHTRDEWAESMRSTVRSHPLAAVAAALALGAVIARITR